MKVSTLQKVIAIAVFGGLSMTAVAGDNSRADRMGERPIEEFSQGSALVLDSASSESSPTTLAASPRSGTLDNLADLKVQENISNYSLRLEVDPDLDALAAPAAGSDEAYAADATNTTLIELPYSTVDYGNMTASEKRQRFFGQDN